MTDVVMDETDELPRAVTVPMSLAVGLARAEVDQQITTARAYPRSLKQVSDRVFSLATLDKESAEESMYALPRGGKPITGPSIRFAEIVKQAYGNCRAAARVVHVDRDEKFVEAEGVFHDLETNVATTARVRRRIVDSKGRLYSDDMIIVTGNAACSIALRNAIMGGVPKPLWRRAYEAVQGTIKGDVTTLTENRTKALQAFAVYGVKPEQVFTALCVAGIEDITVEHIPLLRAMFGTLKNGEATVEEMFGAATAPASAPQNLTSDFADTKAASARKAPKPKAEAAATAGTMSPVEPKATQAAEVAKAEPTPPEPEKVASTTTAAPASATDDDLPASLRGLPEEPEGDTIAEGYPEAGDVYYLTGDGWNEQGRRETYKDGAPFSTSAKRDIKVYEDHPPEGPGGDTAETTASDQTGEGGDDDDSGFPPEFSTYIQEVEDAKSWVEVKKAMQVFYNTPIFKEMTGEQQNKVRANTWDSCVDAKIADLPDQAADASAFRLWTESCIDPDAILGTLRALEAFPAYAAKDPAFRDVIRGAAEKRIADLQA